MSLHAQLHQSVAPVSRSGKLFSESVGKHVVCRAVQDADVAVSYPFFERMNAVVDVFRALLVYGVL